jgi:putative two-component system response regulator
MDAKLIAEYQNEVGSSFVDNLTGLYNHGLFQLLLDREIERVQRHAHPFVLAMIDIDRFGIFNRQHGHYLGDRMLKEVADLIGSNIRKIDVAARYSSATFVVLFVNAGTAETVKVSERIRTAVQQLGDGSLTVSIGLAEYSPDDRDGESLIRKVQDALQAAKLKGKDQVFYYEKQVKPEDESRPRILIVDDSELNLKMLTAMLTPHNYEVMQTVSGTEALNISTKTELDLVLLDVMMPEMDGFEVCRRLKNSELTRMTPVILVTALEDTASRIKGIESGADDFITRPPNMMELIARTKSLINLKKLNKNLTSIENVLFSLAKVVEAKDAYIQGHAERTANLAVAVGRSMDLGIRDIEALRFGGTLHDIGKIGMPNAIINKPGSLDEKEWKIMQSHPEIGYNICLPLENTLGPALNVIRHHHEKLDGSGYPDGLKDEGLSTVARIMAVADIFDALTSHRSYRKAMSKKKAFKILRMEAMEGKLDQVIVEYLIEIIGEKG